MLKNHPIVIVTWVDSVSHSGWHSETEINEFTVHVDMKSVGFLVKQTDDLVAVSANKVSYNYGNTIVIPKVSIKSIIIIQDADKQ